MTTLEVLDLQAEALAGILRVMARVARDAPLPVCIEVNNLVEVLDLLLFKLAEAAKAEERSDAA